MRVVALHGLWRHKPQVKWQVFPRNGVWLHEVKWDKWNLLEESATKLETALFIGACHFFFFFFSEVFSGRNRRERVKQMPQRMEDTGLQSKAVRSRRSRPVKAQTVLGIFPQEMETEPQLHVKRWVWVVPNTSQNTRRMHPCKPNITPVIFHIRWHRRSVSSVSP